MKRTRRLRSLTLPLVLAALAIPATAQNDDASFSGRFLVGIRSVTVGGAESKYRQHFNLDDGPRLFDLNLEYLPGEGESAVFDRLDLDISNFGGDPYESLRFSARKFGQYKFEYNRTKSDFFYEDLILPPDLASVSLSSGGDFHHFDFERVRDQASFNVQFNERSRLDLLFNRYTKQGESTTTLDVQRDEFELDKPIDETLDQFGASFQYGWEKVTLTLREDYRDYENVVEIFLPGFSEGENTTNFANLDFFFQDLPYDFEAFTHSARVDFRPNRRLVLGVSAVLQDLDLDTDLSERSQGTGFSGNPFTTNITGDGDIERDIELFDVDVSYLINERVAFVGGVAQHNLDQEGRSQFADANRGEWDMETTSLEAGVQLAVSRTVDVTVGLREETREVDFGHSQDGDLELEREETDQTGYFAEVAWRPSQRFSLTAEVEDSSYDDPFTLASPTDRQRLRLQGKVNLAQGFYVRGTWLSYEYENDNSGWDADRDHLNLRFGYRQRGLSASLGYSMVEAERQIDQTVTTAPGFGGGQMFLVPVFFESEADFLDGRARYRVSDTFTVGGDLRFYENDGDFAVQRDHMRAYAEIGLVEDYLLQVGYRYVDYEEETLHLNDYDADIVEIAIGYRW